MMLDQITGAATGKRFVFAVVLYDGDAIKVAEAQPKTIPSGINCGPLMF